jgi:hypothetical protein
MNDTETLTAEEEALVSKVVWQLEMSSLGNCLECGRNRMFHLLKPLSCIAVVGMLRARLGL